MNKLWYNEQTNELQSEKPGATIVDEALWQEIYGKVWKNVPADFTPPVRPKEPEPVVVDPEKLAMAQAIADLYEQLNKLKGGA